MSYSYVYNCFTCDWSWRFDDWRDNYSDYSEDDIDVLIKKEEEKEKECGEFQKESHDDSITAKQAINRKRLKAKSDKKKLTALSKEVDYLLPKGKNHMTSNDIKTIKKQVRKSRRETHKEEVKESGVVREKGEFDY